MEKTTPAGPGFGAKMDPELIQKRAQNGPKNGTQNGLKNGTQNGLKIGTQNGLKNGTGPGQGPPDSEWVLGWVFLWFSCGVAYCFVGAEWNTCSEKNAAFCFFMVVDSEILRPLAFSKQSSSFQKKVSFRSCVLSELLCPCRCVHDRESALRRKAEPPVLRLRGQMCGQGAGKAGPPLSAHLAPDR